MARTNPNYDQKKEAKSFARRISGRYTDQQRFFRERKEPTEERREKVDVPKEKIGRMVREPDIKNSREEAYRLSWNKFRNK